MNVFDKSRAETNRVRTMPSGEKVHENERFRLAESRDELVRSMPSGEKVHENERLKQTPDVHRQELLRTYTTVTYN